MMILSKDINRFESSGSGWVYVQELRVVWTRKRSSLVEEAGWSLSPVSVDSYLFVYFCIYKQVKRKMCLKNCDCNKIDEHQNNLAFLKQMRKTNRITFNVWQIISLNYQVSVWSSQPSAQFVSWSFMLCECWRWN